MQSVLGSPNTSYNNTYYAPYTLRLARPTGKPQFNELDTPLQEKRCVTLIIIIVSHTAEFILKFKNGIANCTSQMGILSAHANNNLVKQPTHTAVVWPAIPAHGAGLAQPTQKSPIFGKFPGLCFTMTGRQGWNADPSKVLRAVQSTERHAPSTTSTT
jgi:hypothetical protein